jgi:uncharacterized repeat protein (TIGR02543 family)
MRRRKKLWRSAVALLLTAVMVLGNGAAISAMGEESSVPEISVDETVTLPEEEGDSIPEISSDEIGEAVALDSSLTATEVITSLSYYDAANGASYSLSGVDNVTFGFVMPKYNGKPSSELPLTDVLGDLELQVQVDGNWQNIDDTPYFVFNSTWGWEYQNWGGWICWFKVTETTYLRFHGKTNDVNLPYTLNFTKLGKVTVTSLTNTEPNKTLSTVGGGGIDKGLFIINGDRSIKYDQAADDIDILVKRESESEFVPLFDNPASNWIYDQNFGVYTEGNSGWWFNNVEESFTVRFQAKSDNSIYTEFHMTYIKPNRSNTKLTPYSATKFDAHKPNHEASIGIELPKIDGTPAVKADLEGFVYQICVGATYDSGTDRWSGGEWKNLSDTGATGWVYQGNGYSKYSTSSQWGYWVDYIYGLWFQPVKEDTYLRIGYPVDGTVGGDCGDNYVYYTFIGDSEAVIPDVSDMMDITVDTETSINGDVNDSDITVPGGWDMIWHDEFNGDSVDDSKWSNQTGFLLKEDDITTAGWGNNELEYYTDSDENTSIEDGKLKFTMLKDPKEFSDTNGNTATALYSSGKLISQNKFSVKYGRVDFRAKVPAGNGIWPALWMMPNDSIYGVWASSGEIDVFEGRGRTPEIAFGTLHYGATWPGNRSTGDKLNMVADGNVKSNITEWHVYSLVWEEGNLKIYCDGKCYFKCTNETWYSGGANGNKNAPFDQRFYLIMNLAAGGAFDGNIKPGDDFSQADMYVDYVRVYQKPVAEGEDEKPDTLEGIVTNGSSDGLYGDYKLDKVVAVENITLSKSETSIVAGSSEKIIAFITPEDASNKTVAWSSSDTTVAKVSGGTIMALKPGTATITAKTGDGGMTATCEVTITGTPVTGVALDKETLSLDKGVSVTLKATVTPLDASNKNVKWESSDASVVKVDAAGTVTAVKTGIATISVTTEDGSKTATCEVTVLRTPVAGVALNSNTLSLEEGDYKTLTATVTPLDATNKNVSWNSSDISVAKVDGNGKVTAVKAGTATITVTTEDGGKTSTCEVTVTEKNIDIGRGVFLKNGKLILYVADLPGAGTLLTFYRIYDTQQAAEAAILNNLGGYAMSKSEEKLIYTIDGADLSKYLVYAFQDAPQTLKVVELSSLQDVGGDDENPDPGENLSGKGCIIRDGKVLLYVADSPSSGGVVVFYRYYDTLEEANRAVLANLPGYNMPKTGDVFEYDGGTADSTKYLVYAFNQAGADTPKVIAVKDIPVEAGEDETASYVVNIYKQNKTKDAYELAGTQNKTGIVGDTVAADTTADTGFTYNPLAEGSKTEGTVASDGSLELAVFYDRDKYQITYYINDGENPASNPKEYIYGVGTSTLLNPVKEGFIFVGWYQNPDFSGTKTTYIGTEDTGNRNLYAKWSENGNPIEVTGITLNLTKLELKEGESQNLVATVEPEDATNKNVAFTSTDTTVATVDGTGKVTAVKAGTATITATTEDGGKTATCEVTVTEKNTDTGRGVILKNGKLILYVADLPGAGNLLAFYRIYDTKEAAEAAILNNLGGYSMSVSEEKLICTIDGADLSKYLVYAFQDAPQTLKVVELSSLKDVGGDDENPDPGENLSGKGCIIRDSKVLLYVADSPSSGGVVVFYRYYDTLEEANSAVLANLPGYNMSKNGDVFKYDGGTADSTKYLVYAFNQAGADTPKVIAVKDIPVEAVEDKTAAYVVHIYKQNKTKDAYELADTQNKTGTVGDTVTADTSADTGFTYNPLAEGSKREGTVTSDGKLELAVFYDRDKYEITYYLNDGVNPASNPKEYIYGVGTSTLLDPVKESCTFQGWYQNPDFGGNKTTYIGTEDTGNRKLYAKWSENGNDTIEVTGVTLNFTKLELKEGESKNLEATVEPEDATNKNVVFTSTDTTVATVDGNGKVTAVKAGTAMITVTTVDGSKTASCQVIVMAKDTPKPSNPDNSSSVDSSKGDSTKTISTLKVDFITDKEAKEITANIEAGLQVMAVNHILEITAGIPMSELNKGFTSDYPMDLNITMDTNLLLEEIKQADEKEVQLSIVLPKEINENKKFALSSIILDKKVLTEAVALKKEINVLVKNDKGETEYFWNFDSDVVHEDKNTSINLLVEKMQLVDDKNISKLLNLSKVEKASGGNVIDIKNQSTFPWVSTVTLSVDEKQKGKEVYLYRYNEKTKKLEELPDSTLQVAKDGTVDVSVIQGGKYIILNKKADSKIVTPLTGQIKVSSSKNTLSVNSAGNIKVTLPATIVTVNKFTGKDSTAVVEGKIIYKSGNESIVTVTSTGELTGKKPGKTTIYITVLLKNGTKKTYKSVITVK